MKKFPNLSRVSFAVPPLLLAALFLAAPPCRADDDSQPARTRENRFLFVIDTSSSMRGYSNAVVPCVSELLESDLKGELRQRDTIGIWTYNDKLHMEFPMQIWSKSDRNNIMEDVAAWLAGVRYEKRVHFEKVMPALNQVIKNSERITIILISDGTGLIQGTPFDKDINNLQKKYARELRTARVPFVLVLAAHDGAVFDYTINYPGLIALPHTANPEKPAPTNSPVAAIPAPVAAPPAPHPTSSIIMVGSNTVHAAAPSPVALAGPTPADSTVPSPSPVTPAAPPLANHPVAVVPMPSPPVNQTAAVAMPSPPAIQPANVAPAPPPRPIASPSIQPTPPPVVAQQTPQPAPEASSVQVPPVSVPAPDQRPQPAPPPVANAPVANIAPSGVTQFALIIIAFSLLTIAVVLVVFLVRRSRRPAQSSLISQSMDRPR